MNFRGIKNRLRLLGYFPLLGLIAGCGKSASQPAGETGYILSGSTMGTYYRLTLPQPLPDFRKEELSGAVEKILKTVNEQMSTYLPDSEISLFNQYEKTDWFPVSRDTVRVVGKGLEVYELSGGAFDITVAPLVNLWGFGPDKGRDRVPAENEIREVMGRLGSGEIETRLSPPALKKNKPEVSIDLSAIAKGYGVDRLAEFLESNGVSDYLVDIGGELRAKGRKSGDAPWKIAIESPLAGRKEIQKVIVLRDRAMATSGDYRNYFEVEGVRYSHEIDPRTGWPVTHKLVSVTVLDDTCMRADALATALFVMGPEKGFSLAGEKNLAVYFIIKTEDGFEEKMTPGFFRTERATKSSG